MQIEESGEWRGVHIKKEGSCTDSNDTELNNGGGREGHIIVGLGRNLREEGREDEGEMSFNSGEWDCLWGDTSDGERGEEGEGERVKGTV